MNMKEPTSFLVENRSHFIVRSILCISALVFVLGSFNSLWAVPPISPTPAPGISVRVWADTSLGDSCGGKDTVSFSGGSCCSIDSNHTISFGPINMNLFLVQHGQVWSTTGLVDATTPGAFTYVDHLPSGWRNTDEGSAFFSQGNNWVFFVSSESKDRIYFADVNNALNAIQLNDIDHTRRLKGWKGGPGDIVSISSPEGLAVVDGTPTFGDEAQTPFFVLGTTLVAGLSAATDTSYSCVTFPLEIPNWSGKTLLVVNEEPRNVLAIPIRNDGWIPPVGIALANYGIWPKPDSLAVSADGQFAYVHDEYSHNFYRIDMKHVATSVAVVSGATTSKQSRGGPGDSVGVPPSPAPATSSAVPSTVESDDHVVLPPHIKKFHFDSEDWNHDGLTFLNGYLYAVGHAEESVTAELDGSSSPNQLFQMQTDPTTGDLSAPVFVTDITDGQGNSATGFGARLATDGKCVYSSDDDSGKVFQICDGGFPLIGGVCLFDTATDSFAGVNFTTGEYQVTRCSDNYTVTGKGTITQSSDCTTLMMNTTPGYLVKAFINQCLNIGFAAFQATDSTGFMFVTNSAPTPGTCSCPTLPPD
jgi:hypothetical protein